MRVKTISMDKYEELNLEQFPNFSATGSIKGMKEKYYGKNCLLVKCGDYIYNVTSRPSIYYNLIYN